MKKKLFFLLAVTASFLHLKADSIRVERADRVGPVRIQMPYLSSPTDIKGKSFDRLSFLDDNAYNLFLEAASTDSIVNGEALGYETSSLNVLRFTLDTDRFTKAALDVRKLKDYRIYLNGEKLNDSKLRLLPGRSTVTILCMGDTASRDTFDIQVSADSTLSVKINAHGKRPYDWMDLMTGLKYGGCSLSPSGKYAIVKVYNTDRKGNSTWYVKVYDTEKGREICPRDNYADYKWMARRDIIYYTRSNNGSQELVTLDPATSETSILCTNLPQGGITMSPTEDYLILSRSETPESPRGSMKMLANPNSRIPGSDNRTALFRYDMKSHLVQRLTFGDANLWVSDISADGNKLLLMSHRLEPSSLPFSRYSIYEMNAHTLKVDTIMTDTVFIAQAIYNPDANKLLINGTPASFGGIGSTLPDRAIANEYDKRLFLYDIKTKVTTPILMNFKPSVSKTQWNRNGLIYFNTSDGFDQTLFSYNPTNEHLIRYELPVSCINGYSISDEKNPRCLFYGNSAERARDMYLCRLSRPKPDTRRFGPVDFDLLSRDVALPSCHRFAFPSSRGDSIQGYYYLPADFDATKKYPMVVYYYGGVSPTTRDLEHSFAHAPLTAQGYIVYVVEPSGAIGFGQEFASRHVNTWGKKSGDDIIEGVEAICKTFPFIDKKHIGCIGASYGGFMTEYLQTRTGLFACAISHAGISNIASYWGGGYWGYSYGSVAQYGSYPWNNPDLYVKQSALFNADKINTPLLLLHGTVDTNVPWTESQQLFTALKLLGKRVVFVQVEGENHVITNFKKRQEWQESIFAWFARYLKEQPEWWSELYPDDKN